MVLQTIANTDTDTDTDTTAAAAAATTINTDVDSTNTMDVRTPRSSHWWWGFVHLAVQRHPFRPIEKYLQFGKSSRQSHPRPWTKNVSVISSHMNANHLTTVSLVSTMCIGFFTNTTLFFQLYVTFCRTATTYLTETMHVLQPGLRVWGFL